MVDTFLRWARVKDENSSSEVVAAWETLARAEADGLAVWVESHERKSGGDLVDAGRGSSALGGCVSNIVSLRRPEGKHPDNYRAVGVIGRYGSWQAVVSWQAGQGYTLLGSKSAVATELAQTALSRVMPSDAASALPLKELCAKANTKRTTVQRALKEWLKTGLARTVGSGKRQDPVRYYLTVRFPKY